MSKDKLNPERQKFLEEAREIIDRQWAVQLFHREGTRRLFSHLMVAPFTPHKKQHLIDVMGMSRATLYRSIKDLQRFDLIEVNSETIQWKQNKIGNLLIELSLRFSVFMNENNFWNLDDDSS